MFGYILPEKPELKIKEYEMFRAYYCGVCKCIGKKYGQIPRMALNYDCTFLALLLSSFAGMIPEISVERCIAHPLRKRKTVKKNQIIEYASDINVILAYYNFKDKWKDEKSVLGLGGTIALKAAYRKLKRRYPQKCDMIKSYLEQLNKLEKDRCNSIDAAAEPFAKLMEEIMAFEFESISSDAMKILKWVGYNIGKWIYTLDAYDDIEKDIKNKSYNPLLCQFDYKGEDICEFKSKIKAKVEFSLTYSLGQIANAYELADTKAKSGIVENIIYLGMLRKTEQILAK